MAQDLDMGIVVEGVETKPQVDFLGSIGCEKIQGYYFSRPLPEKEFDGLLIRDQQRTKE
jgi:EAL domain-containing protein (putative c-di-GMP-specific phosphodiesterase class I)